MITVKRPLVAFAAGVVTSFSIGYLGGYILNLALMWAIAMGAGLFMQFVLMLLGILLSAYYGARAGVAVSDYINTGKVDAHYAVVRAWFSPFKPEVVHA